MATRVATRASRRTTSASSRSSTLVGAADNQAFVRLDAAVPDHGVDVSDVFARPNTAPTSPSGTSSRRPTAAASASPGTVFRRDDSPAYQRRHRRVVDAFGPALPRLGRLALGEKIGAPNLFDGTTITGDASGDEDGGRRPPDTAAPALERRGVPRRASQAARWPRWRALPQRRRVAGPRQRPETDPLRVTFRARNVRRPRSRQLNQAHKNKVNEMTPWTREEGSRVVAGGGDDSVRPENPRNRSPPILGPVEDAGDPKRETVEAVLVRETVRGEADGDGAGSSRAGPLLTSTLGTPPTRRLPPTPLSRTRAAVTLRSAPSSGSAACPRSAEDGAASALGVGSAPPTTPRSRPRFHLRALDNLFLRLGGHRARLTPGALGALGRPKDRRPHDGPVRVVPTTKVRPRRSRPRRGRASRARCPSLRRLGRGSRHGDRGFERVESDTQPPRARAAHGDAARRAAATSSSRRAATRRPVDRHLEIAAVSPRAADAEYRRLAERQSQGSRSAR